MTPESSNDVEMARALTPWLRLLQVTVLFVGATNLATTRDINAATTRSAPAVQMLTGVAGTPLVYVVSKHTVGCTHEPCLQLLRTSDNGIHFTTLHLPPLAFVSRNPLGNLSQLFFANSMDGYAFLNATYPSKMYVTVDGAASWHRESIAPGDVIVQLATAHHELYAVIAHCSKTRVCTDYRIARSSLTANKWTIQTLPAPLNKSFFALAAYDANVWENRQGPRTSLLYSSNDQGRTFTRLSAPLLASVSACDLTSSSPTVLWAECPTGMLVSFFYSGDAGAHWNSVSRYEFSGTGGGAFDPVSSSLAYLDFGPFTSRAKDLYRITNSGHTMTPVGNLACRSVNGLVFSDAEHGLAICDENYSVASTYLLRSSDGGATWSKVILP